MGRAYRVGSWMLTGRSCCCCTGPTSTCSAPRAGGLRHGDAGRPRRHRRAGRRPSTGSTSRRSRATTRASSSTPSTAPAAVRGDHHQPRRVHPLRLEPPRRPRRVRRPGRRAAPVQPQRPRAVAPHERRSRPSPAGSIVGFGGFGYELAARAVAQLLASRRMTPSCRRSATPRRPDAVRGRPRRAPRCVVSTPSNIRWLTSFGGSLGWVVVGPDRFVARHRRPLRRAGRRRPRRRRPSTPRSSSARPARRSASTSSPPPATGPVLAEAGHLTHAAWTDLATRPRPASPTPARSPRLRRVKDDGELARMARAAAIADAALADGRADARPTRPTEADVRDELEHRMRRLGADGPSYDTIVASGPGQRRPPAPRDRAGARSSRATP